MLRSSILIESHIFAGLFCFLLLSRSNVIGSDTVQRGIDKIMLAQATGDPGADVLKPTPITQQPPLSIPQSTLQLPDSTDNETVPDAAENFLPNTPANAFTPDSNPNQIPGYIWAEYIGGDPYGTDPFTRIGLTQFLFLSPIESLQLQVAGSVTDHGRGGANLGFMYRGQTQMLPEDQILGAGLWYDVRQSPSDAVFHQLGISLELLDDDWSYRLNGYLPIGPQRATAGQSTGAVTAMFSGNLLEAQIENLQQNESAMRGLDFDIARTLGETGLEGFLGYYHYRGDGSSTDGIKGGLRGTLTNYVGGNITVANDRLFGGSLFGGITFYFDPLDQGDGPSLADRLVQPVQRTPLAVINEFQTPLPSTNVALTQGGNPITVTHVDSSVFPAVGTGEFGNPFATLTEADASMDQIVYVHAESVFDGETFTLAPGQRLLGEGGGIPHLVQTDQLGMIPLPSGNGGMARPVIMNTPAALELSDNSEISKFEIMTGNMTPSVISGQMINGMASINNVDQTGGQIGILLENSPAGIFQIENVNIVNTANRGILAQGTAEVFVETAQINMMNMGGIGIEYINDSGNFVLNNSIVNFNGAFVTTGVRVENTSAMNPLSLDGMKNQVINTEVNSESQNAGGGFNGIITINGGLDDLP